MARFRRSGGWRCPTSSCVVSGSPGATRSCWRCSPPTATRRCSTGPTRSWSTGRTPTGRSASPSARTAAWGRHWPGSRARSSSPRCSRGSRAWSGRPSRRMDGVLAARARAAHPVGAARREAVSGAGCALGDRPRTGRHRRPPALRLDGRPRPSAGGSSSRRSSRTSSGFSDLTAGSCATGARDRYEAAIDAHTEEDETHSRCSSKTGASWAFDAELGWGVEDTMACY